MSLELLDSLSDHKDICWDVAWSRDGTRFATCGADKMINIYKVDACGKVVVEHSVPTHQQRTVRSLSWHPDGTRIAAAGFDGRILIWRLKEGEWNVDGLVQGHQSEVKRVAYNNDGSMLASCGRDRNVFVWVEEVDDYDCLAHLEGHQQDVKCVVWHPHSDTLLSTSYDDSCRLWGVPEDDDDWSCITTIPVPKYGTSVGDQESEAHTSTIWSASFETVAGREPRFVTCSEDKTLKIWGRGESKPLYECIYTLSGYHSRPIYSTDWAKGGHIASCGGDNAICIFEESVGPEAIEAPFSLTCRVPKAHATDINRVAWSPADPTLLASACDEGIVKIWRLKK